MDPDTAVFDVSPVNEPSIENVLQFPPSPKPATTTQLSSEGVIDPVDSGLDPIFPFSVSNGEVFAPEKANTATVS